MANDRNGPRTRLTALIVENQPLIAMDLERILEEAGITVLASLASTRDALEFLTTHSPSFAILDIELGQETSEPIARAMLARKLPFLFSTGYDDGGALPADLANAPVIYKPFEPAAILKALRTLD